MKAVDFLSWHYLIFLLPLGVSLLLLGLSALSSADGDGDSDSGDSDASADGMDAEGDSDSDGEGSDSDSDEDDAEKSGGATGGGVAGLFGIGKAPLSLVLNAFFVVWGVAGFLANRVLLPEGMIYLTQLLPSLGVAFVSGAIAARGVAEMAGRLMPKTETKAISRTALFGLSGRVLFTVTEMGGRIRVYDEHGGMHDEPCRIAPGNSPILKGNAARIMDADAAGNLIVEESAAIGRR